MNSHEAQVLRADEPHSVQQETSIQETSVQKLTVQGLWKDEYPEGQEASTSYAQHHSPTSAAIGRLRDAIEFPDPVEMSAAAVIDCLYLLEDIDHDDRLTPRERMIIIRSQLLSALNRIQMVQCRK
ncbi:MAG: hypothetical protein KDJ67_06525 [Nitratireductor sp.]|nr:hypothetical protein [Nitratireductor sp.]